MTIDSLDHWELVPGPSVPLLLCNEISLNCEDGDIIAETGCGFGRTTHYLMHALRCNTRQVRPCLYAFDTFGEAHTGSEYWEGHPQTTPWGESFAEWSARIGGPSRLLDQFVFHLRNSPARDYLTDFAQFPWWTVAEEFKDDSVSWVVANGAHRSKGILRELEKWLPKLKIGGKIAMYGHDRADFDVKRSTATFFVVGKDVTLASSDNHLIITRTS